MQVKSTEIDAVINLEKLDEWFWTALAAQSRR